MTTACYKRKNSNSTKLTILTILAHNYTLHATGRYIGQLMVHALRERPITCLASHTYFSTRARRAQLGIGGARGKIRMVGQTTHFRVLAECNFRFKTSDYHMIKQADIVARSPFCIVSLHVEHGKSYSPASELALPLLCPWRIAGTHCVRCSIQVMLTVP